MQNEELIPTSVTLPETLLAEIREIAKTEGRSVSSQVRLFLGEAVTRQNTEGGK